MNALQHRLCTKAVRQRTRYRTECHNETITTLQDLPLLLTLSWSLGLVMAVLTNQGTPKHIKISKTFDPTALETAISPYLQIKNEQKFFFKQNLPLFHDSYAGQSVRNRHPSSNKSQPHNSVRNTTSWPYNRDHPHHKIRIKRNPHHGNEKREGVPIFILFRPTIGGGYLTQVMNRIQCGPDDFLIQTTL